MSVFFNAASWVNLLKRDSVVNELAKVFTTSRQINFACQMRRLVPGGGQIWDSASRTTRKNLWPMSNRFAAVLILQLAECLPLASLSNAKFFVATGSMV